MKKYILCLFAVCTAISVYSQQYACKQDTVHFYMTSYRGKMVWQRSDNGMDWTNLTGSLKDTIEIIATDPGYYRAEVIEGLCRPRYSDIVHLLVNEIPVVSLNLADTICENATAFQLNGGSPAGGTYWGNGVIDGKFSPATAGAGLHQIYYGYRDSQTHCADTAFALIRVLGVANKAIAGTDQPLVLANTASLEANTPVNGEGTWSIVSGKGGHFSDIHSPTALFTRDSSNLSFTLRWSINSFCGSSFDEVDINFFPLSKNPCPNAPTVTDADGNVYPTVQIGDQCWMAKNLNVGRFVTSTSDIIPHSNLSNNNVIEKYCYENKVENCELYGGLYDWDEAMGYTTTENAQGICPEGWHIPSEAEWTYLTNYFPTFKAGENLKAGGSSGFEGLFAGDRHALSGFYSLEASGFWWQSNSYIYLDYNEGFIREIEACNGKLTRTHFGKKTGISVRCIKNK